MDGCLLAINSWFYLFTYFFDKERQSSEELLAHLAEGSADIPAADVPGQRSQMQRQNDLNDLEVI